MNKQSKVALATALCAFAGLAAALPSSAQTFATDGSNLNANPFGTGAFTYAPATHYQQYYTFTGGPIRISSISFFSSSDSFNTGTASYNLSILAGTTSRAVGDVSAGFAGFSSAATQVFSTKTVNATLSATNTADLTFTFDTPYTFNPGSGNLLLDFTINSSSLSPNGTVVFVGGGSGTTNSIYQDYDPGATPTLQTRSGISVTGDNRTAGGLRTLFNSSPVAVVPEPSQTAAMVVGALGLLALTATKRRRAAQS